MLRFSAGPAEVIMIAVAAAMLLFPGQRTRRWMGALLPCFVVAAVVTPADPASMFLIALPLSLALTCGVLLAPWLRPARECS
jgi:Sec-independent protein secretion pathway component TatC